MSRTSLSGSTTHAARVPTALFDIVTLSEPGTCAVEGARLATVHEDGAPVEPPTGRLRCERLQHGRLRQQRAAVEFDDALEVGRLRSELVGERAHEGALIVLAREKIEAALEADRRAGLLAHPRAAAERPADVTRPRLREIVELEELAKRREEALGALFRLDGEVGRATSATNSESPVRTSQGSPPRLASAISVGRAWRWPGVESAVMVTSPTVTESPSASGSCSNSTPRPWGHGSSPRWRVPAVLPGHVVGVVVRLEDVRDAKAVLFGEAR